MSPQGDKRGGISVTTLLVSSLSAVLATVIVSQFWEQGTLLFTATVPVAVALLSEAIKRPAERITQVAPLVATPRRRGEPVPEPEPPAEDRFGLYEPERRGGPAFSNRWVRVGVVTGLVAFVIGAAFVTASELTFGGSVGGGERRTTLLGGKEKTSRSDAERDRDPATTTAPDAAPTAAPEPGTEATPAPDATPPPATTPAPTATPPPAATPTPAP